MMEITGDIGDLSRRLAHYFAAIVTVFCGKEDVKTELRYDTGNPYTAVLIDQMSHRVIFLANSKYEEKLLGETTNTAVLFVLARDAFVRLRVPLAHKVCGECGRAR